MSAVAQEKPIPIIDTHIHLFDTTRKQGVPWPPQTDKIRYKPASPARFREVTKGLGIVGAIEVECSPWVDDNQWVLDVAEQDTIMVGTVGNLEPGTPEFRKHFDRLSKNPLFRGIRYGNLWGRNLGAQLGKPAFLADLKVIAEAGLVLDSADPTLQLLIDIVRVSDRVPSLKIVFDHIPALNPPEDPKDQALFESQMVELGRRINVHIKISQVLRAPDKPPPPETPLKDRLDALLENFGDDRVLYGSDWPNSDAAAPYPQVLGVVREYFLKKGREVAEKYFWRNSAEVYRWVKRSPDQPSS